MEQTIHQESFDSSDSPATAITRRIHHIIKNSGTTDILLCNYFYQGKWMSVIFKILITMISAAVTTLHLHATGIDPDIVGNHSLRARGSIILKIKGHQDILIMNIGRWSGLTFL